MILGIDTATAFLSVGLWGEGAEVRREAPAERLHAERLPGVVEDALREAEHPRIDLIAVGLGPGSYTGLRIGASLALGLGRGWGVKVVGVPTLEGVGARAEGRVAVSLDARKGMVYGALFDVAGGVPKADGVSGKFAREEWDALAGGRVRLHDVPPDGAAIARLGALRGKADWALLYG